jgi:RHS repeat-associated protein
MLYVLFWIFLAGTMTADTDPRIDHVMTQLDHLPTWCPSSLLLLNHEVALLDGHHITKHIDEEGRITRVELVRSSDGTIEEYVEARWERGHAIDKLLTVDVNGIATHTFVYDANDCATSHLIERTTGTTREKREISSQFDAQFRPILINEQGGKSTRFSYPEGTNAFLVVVELKENSYFRYAIAPTTEGLSRIEDDGHGLDINDLSDITWRVWTREETKEEGNELHRTVTVGAYDIQRHQDVVLRQERYTSTHEGRVDTTEIVDGDGSLVSITAYPPGVHFTTSSLEALLHFIEAIGSAMSKATPFVADSSSSTATHSATEIPPLEEGDSTHSEQTVPTEYHYEGPFLTRWTTGEGVDCHVRRDCFRRVTGIDLWKNGSLQQYFLHYDALDRLIGVEATGADKWLWSRRFSVDNQEEWRDFTRGAQHIAVHERRDEVAKIIEREEKGPLGAFSSVISSDCLEGDEEHTTIRTITRLPYQSICTEDRTVDGTLKCRQWQTTNGQTILEEHVEAIDAQGSKIIRQKSSGREQSVEWHFDTHGHLASVRDTMKSTTNFSYDDHDHCIAKQTDAGRAIRYEWDAQGRMTRLFSPDGSLDYSYGYDDHGRICRCFDAVTQHTVVRSFDDSGRIVSDGEEETSVRASYDDAGALTELVWADGSTVHYDESSVERRGVGQPWTLSLVPITSCSIQRTPSETDLHLVSITTTDPLGSWSQRLWCDELGQLQREEGEFALNTGFDVFGFPNKALEDGFQYDADGNLVQLIDNGQQRVLYYDALGHLSSARSDRTEERYRYDGLGRLQEIVTNDGTTKRLCWLDRLDIGTLCHGRITELKIVHPSSFLPLAIEIQNTLYRVECDPKGSLIALYGASHDGLIEVYRYSAFGQMHVYDAASGAQKPSASSPWHYCGKRWLPGAAAYDFGPRRYLPCVSRWAEKDPLGLIDTIDDRIFARNTPHLLSDPSGLFPSFFDLDAIKKSLSRSFQTLSHNAYSSLTFAKRKLDWLFEVRATYEDLLFNVLGRAWTRALGYNFDQSAPGIIGKEEKNPKVRITLINGILNGLPEAQHAAAFLSSTHGNIPVHFIYSATKGFMSDMVRVAMAKSGTASYQAKLLIKLWRELITEMGGVSGGGTILHYAHSIGATDTLNALLLLQPEEQAMIRVSTFGSPTLIDEGVCAKVDNYVSVRDGIPVLDYSRYQSGKQGELSHIHFLPSDSTLPFVDHYFEGKTYSSVIELLGQAMQEEFLRS